MIAPKLIAPKMCAYCHEPFTPTLAKQRYCPKPSRCAYLAVGQTLRGVVPVKAIEGKRRRDQARVDATLDGKFGPLTDRERMIYAAGRHSGWAAGHRKGSRQS